MPEGTTQEATGVAAETATTQTDTELAGLKANRDALLAEKKKLEKQLKQYEGLDPEEARRLKTEKEQAEVERLKAKGDFESLRTQLIEKHEKEKQDLQSMIAAKDKALYRNVIEREAIAAISAAGAKVKPLLPHVVAQLRAVEENGDYFARIVDTNGNPRIGDAKGTPMTLAQLVEEFKADPDFQGNFPASGNGGSGAPAGQRSGGDSQKHIKRAEFDALGAVEKAAFFKAGGVVAD